MSRKEIHTPDLDTGQPADIMLKDGTIAVGQNHVETVSTPLTPSYADALAFMEEEIEIMVHESTDPNAENPVLVGNGGIFKAFWRGVPTRAKRKFVDCLCVKTNFVTTPEIVNGGGERAYSIRQRAALKFPFSIIEDRNPKGREWIGQRLAEVI